MCDPNVEALRLRAVEESEERQRIEEWANRTQCRDCPRCQMWMVPSGFGFVPTGICLASASIIHGELLGIDTLTADDLRKTVAEWGCEPWG